MTYSDTGSDLGMIVSLVAESILSNYQHSFSLELGAVDRTKVAVFLDELLKVAQVRLELFEKLFVNHKSGCCLQRLKSVDDRRYRFVAPLNHIRRFIVHLERGGACLSWEGQQRRFLRDVSQSVRNKRKAILCGFGASY